jgi:transmembrane sensor
MKINKDQFQGLLDRYLNGLASPDETKLLDQLFDSYRAKPGDVPMSEETKNEIFQNIAAATGTTLKTTPRHPALVGWLRVAAVISFLLVASYFVFDGFRLTQERHAPIAKIKKVSASKGQKLDLKLPDGSRIKLNSNSTISYPEKFAEGIREVTLEGEAYFDVMHIPSRPFIVHTSNASTRVLGTSFNVFSGDEITAVTLVEGKVNVSIANGPTTLLTPNQQAIITKGSPSIDTHEVDVEKFVGWKNNTLHFNNITVREAFTIIENWYNVRIEVKTPPLLNCIINSKYQNESLENVLNSFRFMLKMDFTINGQQVTVSGKGCPES